MTTPEQQTPTGVTRRRVLTIAGAASAASVTSTAAAAPREEVATRLPTGQGFEYDDVEVTQYRERVRTVRTGRFERVYDAAQGQHVAWHVNDHALVEGPDGTWHMFGIAFPESGHTGEQFLSHATAPSLHGPFVTEAPVLSADPDYGETHLWAPHVVEHEGTWYMFYAGGGPDDANAIMCVATSTDLWHWERDPDGALFADGWEARDPMVLRVGDEWVMYYCATENQRFSRRVVACRTSADLRSWGERRIVYEAPQYGDVAGDTESPFVVEHDGAYYLFVGPTGGYEGGYHSYSSTDVIRSDDPFRFDRDDRVGRIRVHAPEVVRHDGRWWVTHSGVGQNGLYLAELDLDATETRTGVRAAGPSYELDVQASPWCGVVALRTPGGPNLVDDGFRGTRPYLAIGGYGDSPRAGAARRITLDRRRGEVTLHDIPFGGEPVTADWTFALAADWFDTTMAWEVADELSGVVMEGGWSLGTALPQVGDDVDPDRAPGTSAGGLGRYIVATDGSMTVAAAYRPGSMWAEYNRWFNAKVGTITSQFVMSWAGLSRKPGRYAGGSWRVGVSPEGGDLALAERLAAGVEE